MMKLDVLDTPTDAGGVLATVRRPLVMLFNNCRRHPYKMTRLKELMKFMYNACVKFEKMNDEERAKILAEAKELGIDLDERQTTDRLLREFLDEKHRRASEAELTKDQVPSEDGATNKVDKPETGGSEQVA